MRPERLRFDRSGVVPATVRERRYVGASAYFLVDSEDGTRIEVLAEPEAAKVGDTVRVTAERVLTFPEESRRSA